MYCETCDRYEYDQIALDCEICLRCGGPLVAPDDEGDDWSYFPADMSAALQEDGEKLRQMTGEDHGPHAVYDTPEKCTHTAQIEADSNRPAPETREGSEAISNRRA